MYRFRKEKFDKNNGQAGFTIIETIIAILIILTGVVGAYSIITNLTSFGTISPTRFTAVYLAKEGIEIVRNIRDTNWLGGQAWNKGLVQSSAACNPADENACIIAWDGGALQATGGTVPPLKIDSSGHYNYISGTTTVFRRKIKIISVSGYLEVTVKINWTDHGKSYSLSTAERLYPWYYEIN